MTIGAIILAAGSGSRMGLTKQLLKIDGQSLVRRTTKAAIDAGLSIILVTGSDAENVAADLPNLPISIAHNPNWKNGIGTSIRAGISALASKTPAIKAATILLCDQPNLTADVIRQLASAWSESEKPIAACEYSETVGPPCIFDSSFFPALAKIPDTDGAKKILLANAASLIKIPWPQGAQDLDTPADWQHFKTKDKDG
jgi:molybdenum cofactor cytidylyltransferase